MVLVVHLKGEIGVGGSSFARGTPEWSPKPAGSKSCIGRAISVHSRLSYPQTTAPRMVGRSCAAGTVVPGAKD